MIKSERHFIKGTPEIIRLCKLSKELYNRCNYLMRKAWFTPVHGQKYKNVKLSNISELYQEVRHLDCFKDFNKTKIPMQTIRQCLTDWSNYIKALKSYCEDRSKFKSCPKPPNYKKKMAQVIFYNESIYGGVSDKFNKHKGKITPTNNCFSIKSNKKYKQVIITPKTFGFIIDVIYDLDDQILEKETKENDLKVEKLKVKLDPKKVCTIDIGLNNLCAITLDQQRPLLINGRILKSINQFYNKQQSKVQESSKGQIFSKNLSKKRYFRIENYFHHVSKYIINKCLESKTGTIIIGKNNGWKDNINLGNKTNQAFCYISISSLLWKIEYKAKMVGIKIIFTEEAYTSKASFFDNDPLPEYNKEVHYQDDYFSGKRVKRGLYKTKEGFCLNADVNGSLNIGRKVIPEFLETRIGDKSLVARPIIINVLKESSR